MNLSDLDNKRIRVYFADGLIFEGIADHCSADYCYHEYGRDEEALELVNYLFYKSDLEESDIVVLDENDGPYGGFSGPYGYIEESNARDEVGMIEDIFECEEPVYIRRMLSCLEDILDPGSDKEPFWWIQVPEDIEYFKKILNTLIKYSDEEDIRERAEMILEKMKKM